MATNITPQQPGGHSFTEKVDENSVQRVMAIVR